MPIAFLTTNNFRRWCGVSLKWLNPNEGGVTFLKIYGPHLLIKTYRWHHLQQNLSRRTVPLKYMKTQNKTQLKVDLFQHVKPKPKPSSLQLCGKCPIFSTYQPIIDTYPPPPPPSQFWSINCLLAEWGGIPLVGSFCGEVFIGQSDWRDTENNMLRALVGPVWGRGLKLFSSLFKL
jgi:hypothetical protein